MPSSELTRLGAADLARHIRKGHVDPLEVVDAHINQIQRVNPSINALVTSRFDQARDEARRAKERMQSGRLDLPPLLGVPVTVKDSLPVQGVRFTAGSTFHRDDIAVQDAEAVRRLKAAGAIVLGKTNCSDMSASVETTNPIFGLTRNPWKLDHSPGGSSGGEAALIAAYGSPFGLGADFGGSVRIPAAFCGVVGLKPSGGRISTDGHIPQVPVSIREWNTVGLIARCVEDVATAFGVLSDTPMRDYRSIALAGRRLLVPDFLRGHPVSHDVAAPIENAVAVLRGAGMVEKRLSLPLAKVGRESAGILCREYVPGFRLALGGGKKISLLDELLAHYRGVPRVSGACLLLLAMTSFAPILAALGYGHIEPMTKLRDFIIQSTGRGSVMLWPVFPTTAPKHGFVWKPNRGPNYTLVFNCLGFPAIAAPVGLSKEGLPLSVQVIGQPNEDETVLAVAAVLEKAFGGWRMPPIAHA
jgi:Asp-tRNA(Asn)/Glu-tRNA(Gln) amidotransferase A subunit family amidase